MRLPTASQQSCSGAVCCPRSIFFSFFGFFFPPLEARLCFAPREVELCLRCPFPGREERPQTQCAHPGRKRSHKILTPFLARGSTVAIPAPARCGEEPHPSPRREPALCPHLRPGQRRWDPAGRQCPRSGIGATSPEGTPHRAGGTGRGGLAFPAAQSAPKGGLDPRLLQEVEGSRSLAAIGTGSPVLPFPPPRKAQKLKCGGERGGPQSLSGYMLLWHREGWSVRVTALSPGDGGDGRGTDIHLLKKMYSV